METRILFFGRLKDAAGAREKWAALPENVINGASLIDWLCDGDDILHAALTAPDVRLCIDQSVVSSTAPLGNPQEIAFLPPFSGG